MQKSCMDGSQWAFVNVASIYADDPETKLNHLLDAEKTLPGAPLAIWVTDVAKNTDDY